MLGGVPDRPTQRSSQRAPSIDALARSIADVALPQPLLVDAARAAVAANDPDSARACAEATAHALLQPVINATGVLLHTNLGRAPVAWQQDAGYSNLELDLVSGRRGSRHAHAAALLARACGAEAAMIVNNGASAVLLVLAAVARGHDVLVSRGEAVEIGGGFRVPEVMAESGARLVDVGTTNRTRLADYSSALALGDTDVALVLKVHPSNYRIEGFTEGVEVADLATLDVPVVVDIGSGLLDAACPWLKGGPPEWVRGERAARQTLEAGAAAVTFSGDKLLGGPQAGIIAGRRDVVDACARHPLARALRAGGLTLAVLQATALAYLSRDGDTIPFWRMATIPVGDLRARAEAIDVRKVVETQAVAGAGSLPGTEIPSIGLAVPGDHTTELRGATPLPIIARVHDDVTICDLRTVDPMHDPALASALRALA